MRLVRYGALLLGVVLVAAVGVGYALRTSQLRVERFAAVERVAEQSATRLASVVEVAAVAVRLAEDPVSTSGALPALSGVTWTVDERTGDARDAVEVVISGVDETGDDETADREWATVAAHGPALSVTAEVDLWALLVAAANDTAVARSDGWVRDARIVVVSGGPAGGAVESSGLDAASRTVAVSAVGGAGATTVAVSAPDTPGLAPAERSLMLVLVVGGVLLLGLAGATVLAETRSLLNRARFDPLTRLPNRSEFERRSQDVLAAARRDGTSVCLLLFDLDAFKAINDTHGHRVGDEVLTVVAARLRQAVRATDEVARWGGDEFVVVMPGISDVGLARSRALALAGLVTDREIRDGLCIGMSVGAALFPLHGDHLHALVDAADVAMYDAKRAGEVCRVAGSASGTSIGSVIETAIGSTLPPTLLA